MTGEIEVLGATATALMLLVLGWIYYGPWQDLCTDIAREVLFAKRWELFELAAKGQLSFEARNYKTIRASIEQSIRFAHEFTLWRHFSVLLLLRRTGQLERPTALQEAVASIEDRQTRDLVGAMVRDCYLALLGMALIKSPVTLVVGVPIIGAWVVYLAITSGASWANQQFISTTKGIDAEAQTCM